MAIEALASLACMCERMVFGAASLLLDMLNEEVEVVRMQAMHALSQLATAGYLSVHDQHLHMVRSGVISSSASPGTSIINLDVDQLLFIPGGSLSKLCAIISLGFLRAPSECLVFSYTISLFTPSLNIPLNVGLQFLSVVDDISSEMRKGGRNLLASSLLPSFSTFHSIVRSLLSSLEQHREVRWTTCPSTSFFICRISSLLRQPHLYRTYSFSKDWV